MNAWRSVEYTDDGCTEYQCLACKATWESRTNPEHAHWRFCPACGTQWTGRLPDNEAGSEKAWERKSRYWQSRNAERARRLQLPWWQWEYFSHWFPEESWQPDEGKPFQASARQAHNLHKHWHPDNDGGKWRLVLVPSSEQFPLP
jgi:hypothetical protein